MAKTEQLTKTKKAAGTGIAIGERLAAGHELYRPAARVGSAAALQPDGRGLAIPRRFRPAAQGTPGEAAGTDGRSGFGRAGFVCGREHPLRDGFVSGKLEIQHQHSLRRSAEWRRAGALRNGRFGFAVRQDRSALDGGPHPSGDHLAMGRRRGAVHGRPHGGQRGRSAEGERPRQREYRHRQPGHARAWKRSRSTA